MRIFLIFSLSILFILQWYASSFKLKLNGKANLSKATLISPVSKCLKDIRYVYFKNSELKMSDSQNEEKDENIVIESKKERLTLLGIYLDDPINAALLIVIFLWNCKNVPYFPL